MALQSLKTACLVTCAITLMSSISWVKAADEIGQAQPSSSRSITKDSSWSLRLVKDDKVVFRGVVSLDTAGTGTGSIMYPGDAGVGGFLVAVATHGLISESAKNNQKAKLQDEADKVLLPYETILSNYKNRELMQKGLQKTSAGGRKKLIEFSEIPGAEWLVESVPVFLMTQDRSAIILVNNISIYAPDSLSTTAYQNIIKVVSEVKEGKDLVNLWTTNQGEKLKEESASLLAQSLDIAISELAGASNASNNPQKTFRYLEGHSEKMERGQLVSEQCNRVVIKTLRGGLISAPTRREANNSSRC